VDPSDVKLAPALWAVTNYLGFDHRLKDLSQPEHLARLVIAALQQAFPPIRSLETPSTLPTELTGLVGRQREVDEATRLMATTRMGTLTGHAP